MSLMGCSVLVLKKEWKQRKGMAKWATQIKRNLGFFTRWKKGESFDKIKGKETNSNLHLINLRTKKRACVCLNLLSK